MNLSANWEKALAAYKQALHVGGWWNDENYKWTALQWFQTSLNKPITEFHDAQEFCGAWLQATEKSGNLLHGQQRPRALIRDFISYYPDAVFKMFQNLFSEKKSEAERIRAFKQEADKLLEQLKNDGGAAPDDSHFQSAQAISTYLWLYNPKKYYRYVFEAAQTVDKELFTGDKIKKNYDSSLPELHAFYDSVCQILQNNPDLQNFLKSHLPEDDYDEDAQFHTLTSDFIFYVGKGMPSLSASDWKKLIQSDAIFTSDSFTLIRHFYAQKNYTASPAQLSETYGLDQEFYQTEANRLSQCIKEKTDCSLPDNSLPRSLLFENSSDLKGAWTLRKSITTYAFEQKGTWSSDALDKISMLSKGEWLKVLKDNAVFFDDAKIVMKCMLDIGGTASCKQLAEKYGRTTNFYSNNSNAFAQKVLEKMPCHIRQREKAKYAPLLYDARKAKAEEAGTCIWILRSDLKATLDKIGILQDRSIPLYANDVPEPVPPTPPSEPQYWFLVSKPKIMSFANMKIGETVKYTLLNELGNPRRVKDNFYEARSGDKVIAYESTPAKQIVALATVAKEQDGKTISIKKEEDLINPISYWTLKACAELNDMEFFKLGCRGTLFKLKQSEYESIMDLINEENDPDKNTRKEADYNDAAFLDEVYMDKAEFDRLKSILTLKKNIILQGPPGVGKTFAAKRLAYAVMQKKDESCIKLIQFHQNYSYEDFIMGYKPTDQGFALRPGVFYNFCLEARNHPDKKYFFIIDEINRGNLSKVFGELFMLVESSYRGTSATLAYTDEEFSIPENLYLIGMMNTADRSLAMVDYALRRRFSFFTMKPNFKALLDHLEKLDPKPDTALLKRVFDTIERTAGKDAAAEKKGLNQVITEDRSLGKGFCIGHSYFCDAEKHTTDLKQWLENVIDYDIFPMLCEYWFDDTEEKKANEWRRKLLNTLTETPAAEPPAAPKPADEPAAESTDA